MKFSRNPESGILECYTDDGAFIGSVYTSEPESSLTTDSLEEITEDGGAGSGNFGHKGRPGQVGGSGKGGGSSAGTAYSDGNGGLTSPGAFTSSFRNKHVSEDHRAEFKSDASKWKSASRNYFNSCDGKTYAKFGMNIRDEISERVKLRKKAKDLPEWNKEGKVQTEDIYDVLRDCRSFGATTEEAQKHILPVFSELPQERTDAIVKEALDSVPTDWLEQAEFPVQINIIDASGFNIGGKYMSHIYGRDGEGTITIYARESPSTVKELDLKSDKITDMGLANTLRHELGHYIEESNYGIGSLCRDYLEKRTKDSPEEWRDSFAIKPDKFFREYMGRQYNDGSTEILSCCLQALGYSNPAEYMKNSLFGEHDTDSYKFVLGLLAFHDGGYF